MKLRISGQVQGVGFRYYTQRKAESLSITGWVRNLPDGNVEILAQGKQENLQKFIDWCHQGPASACVRKVQVEEKNIPSQTLSGFEITTTASN